MDVKAVSRFAALIGHGKDTQLHTVSFLGTLIYDGGRLVKNFSHPAWSTRIFVQTVCLSLTAALLGGVSDILE